MFFLGIFVVVSVYLCVMYCKKFLTDRVDYYSNNNNSALFNQHPHGNSQLVDNDVLVNNSNKARKRESVINNNSNHECTLQSVSKQLVKLQRKDKKEELREQLMINNECIEMIDINNPLYEPQVIQHNLYVNTYTNKGEEMKGNKAEDDNNDNNSETPEGEEVPNASHDLIIDE